MMAESRKRQKRDTSLKAKKIKLNSGKPVIILDSKGFELEQFLCSTARITPNWPANGPEIAFVQHLPRMGLTLIGGRSPCF